MSPKKTILLVEDESLIAMVERSTLERFGYAVLTVNTGEKAVEVVEKGDGIDLILMDIDLGEGIDGTVAAEMILQNHDLPVVFLSSHTEPEVVEKTEGITSYGYIVKNSGETVLHASIKMAFRLFEEKQNTLRKEAELRKSETRYRYVVENSNEGIVVVKGNSFLYVNPMTGTILGYPEERLYEVPFKDFIIPEDRPGAMENYRRYFDGDSPEKRFDVRVKTGYDDIRWLEFSGVVISWDDEPALLGFVSDITDRKTTEKIFRRNTEYLETILHTTVDGFWVIGSNGKIVDVNEAYSRMSGYSRSELTGMGIDDLDAMEDPEETAARVARIAKNGSELFETQHKRKDGSVFNVEISASSFEDMNERKIVCFCRDISARIAAASP
jgi:PAS domain S-box-containing protein